jgi:hypothetical protein
MWIWIAAAGLLIWLIVRVLHKKTSILEVDGR